MFIHQRPAMQSIYQIKIGLASLDEYCAILASCYGLDHCG